MKTKTLFRIIIFGFAAMLFYSGSTLPVDAAGQQISGKELIRNGNFNLGKAGWNFTGSGSGVMGGQYGKKAASLEAIMENRATLYQEIYLPTQISAASVAFAYRMGPTYGGAAQLHAQLVTNQTTLKNILVGPTVSADTGWNPVNIILSAADITKIQSAHAAGQSVFLMFTMSQNRPNALKTWITNISFKASGTLSYPNLSGSIAYTGFDNSGNPHTVKRVSPAGGFAHTLWKHPGGGVPKILDVAWKPDGSELAFASNHESSHSAFHVDIYGIRPNGSSLRRITNPPSIEEISSGKYRTGSVIGKIYNNYSSNVTPFLLYIEGATKPVSIAVGRYQQVTPFKIDAVADLGSGVLQYAAFSWSSVKCANGREFYPAAVDVKPGGTVDVGTLQFNGYCNTYYASDISWRGDGSFICYSVGGQAKKIPAAGGAIGQDLLGSVSTVCDLSWSPVTDLILYRQYASAAGIYAASAGSGPGTLVVRDGNGFAENPAWLPDGSGFVFTFGGNLYHFQTASNKTSIITNLNLYNEAAANPAVSPDGRYIVFERMSNETNPPVRDIWIINGFNVTEMWPLTNDGRSGNPHWGKK